MRTGSHALVALRALSMGHPSQEHTRGIAPASWTSSWAPSKQPPAPPVQQRGGFIAGRVWARPFSSGFRDLLDTTAKRKTPKKVTGRQGQEEHDGE
eukprot:CAMPEP_0114174322 /NCGR_PEP_ID=MMETSP0043_2-20121206/36337_1 /TAXON_ID=464988 /ORGANISM="Hemiselmis andersenii, Strain CCMP644" /LENGTH=95 /DNA_ID=CAMNT_0001272437 /DNA_START=1 /DNA_END=285 /DNA_ORIENTATION=+